jgi:potassium inwardly-rectifying channel subfamily J
VQYLMFRIGELRRHQLLEATVRAYCIRQERHLVASLTGGGTNGESSAAPTDAVGPAADGSSPSPRSSASTVQTTHYVTKPMKLQHEEIGSHILMSLPQVIVHRMDETSPLVPPRSRTWYDAEGQPHSPFNDSATASADVGLNDRGTTTAFNLQHYVEETKQTELFIRDRRTEIVILVEGTDELTGAPIQARHSYTYDDLAWNETFVPCVFPNDDGRALARRRRGRDPPVCIIDFSRFHETQLAPIDFESCPYVTE